MNKLQKVWILIFLCISLSFNTSYAFQNEPVNGFKDLYWGETLQEIQEQYETDYFNYIPKQNAVTYLLFNDDIKNSNFSIGNIKLESAVPRIYLWNNQLYRIDIYTTNITGPVDFSQQYNDLSSMMKVHFGEPILEYANEIAWLDDSFAVLLRKDNSKYGDYIFGNELMIVDRSLDNLASQDAASSGW